LAAAFRLPVTLLTKESAGALIEPTAALFPNADYPCRFNVIAGLGERGGEIDGDGCLADATLLIEHPDDHPHPHESHLRFYDFAIFRLSGRDRLAGGGRARQLHMIALEEDTTLQALMAEAFQVFAKRGKPPIA
jgi:hypothetical protein